MIQMDYPHRGVRVKRGDRDESIFAWTAGRGEKLETAISGEGPGSAIKEKEIYGVEDEVDKQNCPCGKL